MNSLGRASAFAVSLVVSASLLGCSNDDDDSANECNTLVNNGPAVTPRIVASGTKPKGGTIADGTYEQTGFDSYPNADATLEPDERTFAAVFEFHGGSAEIVIGQALEGLWDEDRYSATYTTSGTELTFRYSCPDDNSIERPRYTATETELRLYYSVMDDDATAEITLSKR